MARIVLILLLSVLIVTFAEKIHLVTVCCGAQRREETLASIRSALFASSSSSTAITFHIVHKRDDENDRNLTDTLIEWQSHRDFEFVLYETNLKEPFLHLFAPCASQRLFLHSLLPTNIDRVIYVDSDTIFLADPYKLWNEFEKFNSNTVAALVAEDEGTVPRPYYRKELQHPYYQAEGAVGLNSGIMLLDLGRLRRDPWDDEMLAHLKRYKLEFFDQDLLNIYFSMHPDKVRVLSCEWNFRTEHCYTQQYCTSILLLHGNRGVFHENAEQRFPVTAFRLVYQSYVGRTLGSCSSVQDQFKSLIQAQQGKPVGNNCEMIVLAVVLFRLQDICRTVKDEL